jgi:hypothetical protein
MLRIFFPLLFNTDDDKKNNYAVELIATEGSTTIVEEGHFKSIENRIVADVHFCHKLFNWVNLSVDDISRNGDQL